MISSRKFRWASILILLVTSNCGRKQRNIFSFQQQEETIKLSVFDFPSPKGIEVCKVNEGIKITWTPLNVQAQNKTAVLLGYNVYRLNQTGFIPKKPLNQSPLKETFFLDLTISHKKQTFYLIKAVYCIKNKRIEGLSSQIKTY